MALDLVANLVRQATVDSGVIYALQYNPEALRSRLGLSPAHVTALKSAEAFPLPAASLQSDTTQQSDRTLVGVANGNLLPPEGQGPEPAGDLQVTAQPIAPYNIPRHGPGPKTSHPAPRTPAPAVPGIRSTGHGHLPAKRIGPRPGPQVRQPSAAVGTLSSSAAHRQPVLAKTGQESPCIEIAAVPELQAIVAAAGQGAGDCDCACCVGTVANVAAVASTAQAAIAAITAIANIGN